jgi:uncharacterized protein
VPRRGLANASYVDLAIPDLAPAFADYRIAVLADLHHRGNGDLAWLDHAVDVVNGANVDLIALLGDYGESFKRAPSLSRRRYHAALAEMTPVLARLRARGAVVGVLGNHDYYADAEMVTTWLRQLGADALVNRSRHIARAGDALRIAGIDDAREGRHDPFAGSDVAERTPTIVLSHNPDGILGLDPRLRVDAVIAGHTHGGQIVVPGYGAPLTMARACGPRTASGWVPNPRTNLYVTRGLGEQLPMPVRFNCPREILVLRLRSGGQQPA